MNVSLTPELKRWVEEQVQSDDYQTGSEVVREAVRLMKRRAELVADIREKLAEAEEDIKAGRVIPGDQIVEEVIRLGRQRRRQSKAKGS